MIIFSIVMSAVCTTLLTIFGGFVTQWLDFWMVLLMLFGFYWAWIGILIILAFLVTLPVNKKKPVTKPSKFYTWLFNVVNDFLVQQAGVKVKMTGVEKMDKNTPYLFVANHRSNFDPQIIAYMFKKYKILYISKPSNFKIPIAGPCIHAAGYMPIDRDNDRKAMETILKAIKYAKQGYSIGLFPEGTRNKDSLDLMPFKNGGLKIAQKAQMPIVVIALNDTQIIHKNFPWRRTTVYLDVVEVISANDANAYPTTTELGDHCAQLIQAQIDKYKQR